MWFYKKRCDYIGVSYKTILSFGILILYVIYFFQFIGEEDLFERRDDKSDPWNPKAKVVEYGHGGAGGQPAPPGSGPAESQDNRWSRDQLDNNPTRYDHGRDHEQQRPGPSYAGQDSKYQDPRQSHDQRGYSQER